MTVVGAAPPPGVSFVTIGHGRTSVHPGEAVSRHRQVGRGSMSEIGKHIEAVVLYCQIDFQICIFKLIIP